jgi:hypothetical protein
LAHTVGLGENVDQASVMYEYLTPGTVRRTFTERNLALINTDADRYMKVGGGALVAPCAVASSLPAAPALARAFASQEQGGRVQRIPSGDRPTGVFGDGTHAGATAAWFATGWDDMLPDLPGSLAAPFAPGASGTDGLRREVLAGGSLDVLGGDGDEWQIGSQATDVLVGYFGRHGRAGVAGFGGQEMGTEPMDLFCATEVVDLSFASE